MVWKDEGSAVSAGVRGTCVPKCEALSEYIRWVCSQEEFCQLGRIPEEFKGINLMYWGLLQENRIIFRFH